MDGRFGDTVDLGCKFGTELRWRRGSDLGSPGELQIRCSETGKAQRGA